MRPAGILVLLVLLDTAYGGSEERDAFLELQAAFGRAEPEAVIEAAEAFRAAYPRSDLVHSATLIEIHAYTALGQTAKAAALRFSLLHAAPESAAARGALASYANVEEFADAVGHLIDGYLTTREAVRLHRMARLFPVLLSAHPEVASRASIVLPGLAIIREDSEFRRELVEHAKRLGSGYASIRDALTTGDTLDACVVLQAHDGEHSGLAHDCAALLLAEVPPDALRARLARARADLAYRGATPPAPLLELPITFGDHAYLAALALIMDGRPEEARTLHAKHKDRLPADGWTKALEELMQLDLSVRPARDALRDRLLLAFKGMLAGAECWSAALLVKGEGIELEVRARLDFSSRQWKALAKLGGYPVAILHGTNGGLRCFASGEPRIFEMRKGLELPAIRLQLERTAHGIFTHFGTVSGTHWTDTGRINVGLRRNPVFTTAEGIDYLLGRIFRPGMPAPVTQEGDGVTSRWLGVGVYRPDSAQYEFRFDSSGRLASVGFRDGDRTDTLTLHYGASDDVGDLELPWPDLPVKTTDQLDLALLMRLAAHLMEKADLD